MIYRESMGCTEQAYELVKEALEKIQVYITPLFPSGYDMYKPTNEATGTFVIINGKKGILTNAHVTDAFREKNSAKVLIPNLSLSGKLISLPFLKIIFLPQETYNDIDMAFIHLTNDACNLVSQIGKKFWNLDDAALEWEKNNWDSRTESSLWIIYGNVAEGRKFHRNCNIEYMEYKNSGYYIVVPDLKNIKENRFRCLIETKNRVPKSFEGMSGGALWQIIQENFKMSQILLRGIATQYSPTKKAQFLLCYGPAMIYEIFYPFCVNCLQHDKG